MRTYITFFRISQCFWSFFPLFFLTYPLKKVRQFHHMQALLLISLTLQFLRSHLLLSWPKNETLNVNLRGKNELFDRPGLSSANLTSFQMSMNPILLLHDSQGWAKKLQECEGVRVSFSILRFDDEGFKRLFAPFFHFSGNEYCLISSKFRDWI